MVQPAKWLKGEPYLKQSGGAFSVKFQRKWSFCKGTSLTDTKGVWKIYNKILSKATKDKNAIHELINLSHTLEQIAFSDSQGKESVREARKIAVDAVLNFLAQGEIPEASQIEKFMGEEVSLPLLSIFVEGIQLGKYDSEIDVALESAKKLLGTCPQSDEVEKVRGKLLGVTLVKKGEARIPEGKGSLFFGVAQEVLLDAVDTEIGGDPAKNIGNLSHALKLLELSMGKDVSPSLKSLRRVDRLYEKVLVSNGEERKRLIDIAFHFLFGGENGLSRAVALCAESIGRTDVHETTVEEEFNRVLCWKDIVCQGIDNKIVSAENGKEILQQVEKMFGVLVPEAQRMVSRLLKNENFEEVCERYDNEVLEKGVQLFADELFALLEKKPLRIDLADLVNILAQWNLKNPLPEAYLDKSRKAFMDLWNVGSCTLAHQKGHLGGQASYEGGVEGVKDWVSKYSETQAIVNTFGRAQVWIDGVEEIRTEDGSWDDQVENVAKYHEQLFSMCRKWFQEKSSDEEMHSLAHDLMAKSTVEYSGIHTLNQIQNLFPGSGYVYSDVRDGKSSQVTGWHFTFKEGTVVCQAKRSVELKDPLDIEASPLYYMITSTIAFAPEKERDSWDETMTIEREDV